MTATASCPECGAEVRFTTPGSVLSVCTSCQSVVAKRGLDYAKLGKVAELAEIPSPLRLGLRGAAHGGFQIVGRIQLDHGAGTWNEWYLALDNGRWLWLAEVQGGYYLSMPLGAVQQAPAWKSLRVGDSVKLPVPEGARTLRITEVHTARLVSAQGELPFEVTPGEAVRYADLSGEKGSFGTLDYGSPDDKTQAVQGFFGQKVRPDSLQIDQASFDVAPPQTAKAGKRMSCPQCDGALALLAPDATLRVTCPYCRALIDVSSEPLRALTTLKPPPEHLVPILALGKTGKLRGRGYTVLGHLRRNILKPGSGFWDEYLLYTGEPGDSAFNYLVYSGGHFTLAVPIAYGDIAGSGKQRVYAGNILRRVESCTTCVSYVSGEFPWAVEIGETVEVEDFATSGLLLSIEKQKGPHQEINASLGHYLDSEEVFAGFALSGSPPRKEYVAPHQPNPYTARLVRQKSIFLMASVALCGLLGWSCARSGTMTQSFSLSSVPGVEPAAEHILISDPFELGKRGQQLAVTVELRTEVENSWAATDVSLINEDDGQVFSVPLEAAYYHGTSDGESWSEGSRTVDAVIPFVPAGRYVARLEPAWPVSKSCSFTSDCDIAFVCESGRCIKHCIDTTAWPESTDPDVLRARTTLNQMGAVGCGTGYVCQNSQCVLSALEMKVKLSYPTLRFGYAFFLWLFMALVPGWNLLRARQFEQRRAEDNA